MDTGPDLEPNIFHTDERFSATADAVKKWSTESQRWSSAGGGPERTFVDLGQVSRLYNNPERRKFGVLEDLRLSIEFGHGFGFGKRLKSLEEYRIEGDRIHCAGPMQIWELDVSYCSMEIDRDLIVRRASIESRVRADVSLIEIETDGVARPEGAPPVAASGHFKRSSVSTVRNGEVVPMDYVVEDTRYTFIRIKPDLSDAEYAAAVETPVRADTKIINIGEQAVPKAVLPSEPQTPVGRGRLMVIVNAGIVVLLAAFTIFRRWRTSR